MTRRRAGRRRRYLYGGTASTAAAVAALVVLPTTAWAQPFGPGACGGGCYYADNSNETFYYDGLTVTDITATEAGRARLEATDMTTTLQTASYNSDTDIVVRDYSVPGNGAYGWWFCDTLVAGDSTKCNQGFIVINLAVASGTAPMTCQEIGHGVGLDHSSSTGSCMYQDPRYAASDYDTHDKGHINGRY